MVSFCRAAAAAARTAARSAALRSPKPAATTRAAPLLTRSLPPALGAVMSLMPFHTATATARLRSNIAADSSCWSWLSQDFAVPR